jgi:hypothetical protein
MKNSNIIFYLAYFIVFSVSCEDELRTDNHDNDQIVTYVNESAFKMKAITGLPLESDCFSIDYYIRSGGMQDITMLARFQCNLSDVEKIITRIENWNDKQIGRKCVREIRHTTPFGMELIPKDEALKITWWKLREENVVKSILCKEGFGCSIWIERVDASNSVFVNLYQSP